MKKTYFFENDELFFDKEGIIREAGNLMDNDFPLNTINLIPYLKSNAEALDLTLRWIHKFHHEKFAEALPRLVVIPYSTISKVTFLADKFTLSKEEIGNDPKFVDIKFNKSTTTTLTFVKDYKNTLGLKEQAWDNMAAMIHTVFIATKFNDKNEVIKNTLNDLINQIGTYHKMIGQNNVTFLASFDIIIGCLKLPNQEKFINHYQNIVSEFKNQPRLAYNCVRSLIKSNKFNLVENFLKILENGTQDIVDKKNLFTLYQFCINEIDKCESIEYYIKALNLMHEIYKSDSAFLNTQKPLYFNLILNIISNNTQYELLDEVKVNAILNKIVDEDNKKFLICFKNYINNKDNKFSSSKFDSIEFFKIDISLKPLYIYLKLNIKYSKTKIINSKSFFDEINNQKDLSPNLKIKLYINFKQKDLARKYINSINIKQFGDNISANKAYLWYKFTLQKHKIEDVFRDIDAYINSNSLKAEFYYSLSLHYSEIDYSYSFSFLKQVNKMYSNNEISKNGLSYKKFVELRALIEAYKILKQKQNSSEEYLEEDVNQDNIGKNNDNVISDHKANENIDKLKEEPDYSIMSSQEIYNEQEEIRIKKQLESLKKQEKTTNSVSDLMPKKTVAWKYKGEIINKTDCHKLYQKVGNKWEKYYAIIDSKIIEKIKDIEPFERALKKSDLGPHKQNGIMNDKNKAYKITADTDLRIYCNKNYKFTINSKEYKFIVFDKHGNHDRYDNFVKNSDGIEEISISDTTNITGNTELAIVEIF